MEQRGGLGAAGTNEPVLGVIAVGHAAVREIAVRIIGEVCRSRTRILVEAVGGIGAVDVERASERKAVVRQTARRDLPHPGCSQSSASHRSLWRRRRDCGRAWRDGV